MTPEPQSWRDDVDLLGLVVDDRGAAVYDAALDRLAARLERYEESLRTIDERAMDAARVQIRDIARAALADEEPKSCPDSSLLAWGAHLLADEEPEA